MDLYVFDCDVLNGIAAVEALRLLASKGNLVVLLARSFTYQELWKEFPTIIVRSMWVRDGVLESLRTVRNEYPRCGRYFFVSDRQSDQDRATQAGYCYMPYTKVEW